MSFAFLASSFGSGFLVSLSPCCFPMIPIILGYFGTQAGNGHKAHVVAFFIGKVIAFTILGFVAVKLGEIFGFSSQNPLIMLAAGVTLIVFGLFSFFSFLPSVFSKWNGLARKFKSEEVSLTAAVLLGISTALISSPCSTPILGTILMTIANEGNLLMGGLSMIAFAFGAAFIFLVVGLGLVSTHALPKKGPWMKNIHRLGSLLVLGTGLFYVGKAMLNLI